MTSEKINFYDITKPMFEAGLMSEIYSSDDISVCNISNYAYYVFKFSKDFTHKVDGKDCPIGILLPTEQIDKIIGDNNKLLDIIKKNGPQYFEKNMIVLFPEIIKTMYDVKEKSTINGPGPNINFDWEEEIKTRTKSL